MRLLGPFTQLLPLDGLPTRGAIQDHALRVIENGGIVESHGKIIAVGTYQNLRAGFPSAESVPDSGGGVALPGFVDSHTHICFDGSRAADYARRNAGLSYQEIARQGGGIWNTVNATRQASTDRLTTLTARRARNMARRGCTTIEVKSGYGLSVEHELRMLRAIHQAQKTSHARLISTCLAAHICPKDWDGDAKHYLEHIAQMLLPQIRAEGLSNRVDIFVEQGAFTPPLAIPYLEKCREMGFDLTIHADQFSVGGSELAIEFGAKSADHLEASGERELLALAKSSVVATALPGASLGLGCAFTPGRKLLDADGILAIASDYNPGSAPMGDLLTQAAIFGAAQKLSNAEVLSGITQRGAWALGLRDRGILAPNYRADLVVFDTIDHREILYHQGQLGPSQVWVNGQAISMQQEDQ